jgi:hypothetical protein
MIVSPTPSKSGLYVNIASWTDPLVNDERKYDRLYVPEFGTKKGLKVVVSVLPEAGITGIGD